MKELRRFLSRQPEVALGIAAFAGLAIGAGWLPVSLPSLGSLMPAKPAAAPASSPAPASVQAAATATPATDAGSMWD